jgi:sugar phosphate permease
MSTTLTGTAAEATLGSIMRKVQWRLVPVLLLMYTLAFLDRVNIGFAKTEYMADTGLTEAAYALGAGIFFIAYAFFEVPSNLLLHKVGAKFWLARIMVTWGAISALMMFAHNEWIFYGVRVLLGVAEAGLFPGVILYITYWAVAEYRSRFTGLFMMGIPLAYVLGGPVSGAFLDMNGMLGLAGWQWMFGLEGLLTVVFGVWVYFYMDSKPNDAKWLNAEEKKILNAAIALDNDERAAAGRGHHEPWYKPLTNPRLVYIALCSFSVQICMYGFTFYLPSQVQALTGQKVGFLVGVITAIPWLAALVITRYTTLFSDKTGQRRWTAVFAYSLAVIGLTGSVLFKAEPIVAIAFLCLVAGSLVSVQPIMWTFPASILTGAAAAAGIGLINSLGNLGGFFAPNIRAAVLNAYGFVSPPKTGTLDAAQLAVNAHAQDMATYTIAGVGVIGMILFACITFVGYQGKIEPVGRRLKVSPTSTSSSTEKALA